MANILYANNAAGTLAAAITNAATSLTLQTGQGAIFPNPSAPQIFYATLTDAATQSLIEIIKVTAVSGDIFSIVRAQDGTSALSWNAGDIVSLRVIRTELQGFENAAEGLFGATGNNIIITPSSTLGIAGTTTNDDANVGSIGEFINPALSSIVLSSSGVPNAAVSVFLRAGDWDVSVLVNFRPAPGVSVSSTLAAISLSAAVPAVGAYSVHSFTPAGPAVFTTETSPTVRIRLAATTAVFGVAQATFTGGACAVDAFLRARRVR